jgi:hypothetical protein
VFNRKKNSFPASRNSTAPGVGVADGLCRSRGCRVEPGAEAFAQGGGAGPFDDLLVAALQAVAPVDV